jgi:hypothetical protein
LLDCEELVIHHVVLHVDADTSIFRVEFSYQYLPVRLHGVMTQNTTISKITAIKNSELVLKSVFLCLLTFITWHLSRVPHAPIDRYPSLDGCAQLYSAATKITSVPFCIV